MEKDKKNKSTLNDLGLFIAIVVYIVVVTLIINAS